MELPTGWIDGREHRQGERLSAISAALTELLERTPAAVDEDPAEIFEARTQLRAHFEAFPRLIPAFVHALRDALVRHGWKPGTVEAAMVGGRLLGTPLKNDSDVDILFFCEQPIGPTITTAESRLAWIRLRRELVFGTFRALCEQEASSFCTGANTRKQP